MRHSSSHISPAGRAGLRRALLGRAILCLALLAGLGPARALEIYRYLMPDGSTLFTNEISSTGKLVEIIIPHAPPQRNLQQEQQARAQQEAQRLAQLTSLRGAASGQIESTIDDLRQQLAKAKAAAASGAEPLLGERIGIKGGHTRLTDGYWARQRELQQAVEQIRARLDDVWEARAGK
jgi:hypothetical protein